MRSLEGGCSCGAVRFTLHGALWVVACHCNVCKKRTGSAFGVSVVVEDHMVKSASGTTKTFIRRGESGKAVHYEFCPECGTTVRWRVEPIANRHVYAAGTLDDPTAIEVVGEMYTATALPGAQLGCELARVGGPDDEFRKAAIEKTRARGSFE